MPVRSEWSAQEQRALREFDSYLYGTHASGWDVTRIPELQTRAEEALRAGREVLDPRSEITIGHFESRPALERFLRDHTADDCEVINIGDYPDPLVVIGTLREREEPVSRSDAETASPTDSLTTPRFQEFSLSGAQASLARHLSCFGVDIPPELITGDSVEELGRFLRHSDRLPLEGRSITALDLQLRAGRASLYQQLISTVTNAAPALQGKPTLNEKLRLRAGEINVRPIVSPQDARQWLEQTAERIDLRRIGYLESNTEQLTARQLAQKIFDAHYVWYYRNPTEYDATTAGQQLFTLSREALSRELEQAVRVIEGRELDLVLFRKPSTSGHSSESLDRTSLLSQDIIGTLEHGRFPHAWAAIRFVDNFSKMIGEDIDLNSSTLEQVLEKSRSFNTRAEGGEFSVLELELEAERQPTAFSSKVNFQRMLSRAVASISFALSKRGEANYFRKSDFIGAKEAVSV